MRTNSTHVMIGAAVIGLALLIADRFTRLRLLGIRWEGFQNEMAFLQRCGVEYPPCGAGKKCMNGFCLAADVFVMKEKNPLPVLP